MWDFLRDQRAFNRILDQIIISAYRFVQAPFLIFKKPVYHSTRIWANGNFIGSRSYLILSTLIYLVFLGDSQSNYAWTYWSALRGQFDPNTIQLLAQGIAVFVSIDVFAIAVGKETGKKRRRQRERAAAITRYCAATGMLAFSVLGIIYYVAAWSIPIDQSFRQSVGVLWYSASLILSLTPASICMFYFGVKSDRRLRFTYATPAGLVMIFVLSTPYVFISTGALQNFYLSGRPTPSISDVRCRISGQRLSVSIVIRNPTDEPIMIGDGDVWVNLAPTSDELINRSATIYSLYTSDHSFHQIQSRGLSPLDLFTDIGPDNTSSFSICHPRIAVAFGPNRENPLPVPASEGPQPNSDVQIGSSRPEHTQRP